MDEYGHDLGPKLHTQIAIQQVESYKLIINLIKPSFLYHRLTSLLIYKVIYLCQLKRNITRQPHPYPTECWKYWNESSYSEYYPQTDTRYTLAVGNSIGVVIMYGHAILYIGLHLILYILIVLMLMHFSYAKEPACIAKLPSIATARIPCTWIVI